MIVEFAPRARLGRPVAHGSADGEPRRVEELAVCRSAHLCRGETIDEPVVRVRADEGREEVQLPVREGRRAQRLARRVLADAEVEIGVPQPLAKEGGPERERDRVGGRWTAKAYPLVVRVVAALGTIVSVPCMVNVSLACVAKGSSSSLECSPTLRLPR